jgi:hypothetical protein
MMDQGISPKVVFSFAVECNLSKLLPEILKKVSHVDFLGDKSKRDNKVLDNP